MIGKMNGECPGIDSGSKRVRTAGVGGRGGE